MTQYELKDGFLVPAEEGRWVRASEAKPRIVELEQVLNKIEETLVERDARITELEGAQQNGHAALTAQIAENTELKRKLDIHGSRLGTALKTRRELLAKLAERDKRIAELEADLRVERAFLALAEARLNRELLNAKGGA